MNKCLCCGEQVKNKYCDVSCQNKHQNPNKANKIYGLKKSFKVICNSCGNVFYVIEREKLHPVKDKYYCTRSCSNRRKHSKKTKNKISKSLTKEKTKKRCKNCGDEFYLKKQKQIFCSRSCATSFRNNNGLASKAGKASASKIIKRSKNEIYFANLCKSEFNDVDCNKPIFNGWDADVIIHDIGVAILWNGKWHYEKITEAHSLKQVQNRDKIKQKEIINYGYLPYTIKDLGKHSKKFVEKEFKNFIKWHNQIFNPQDSFLVGFFILYGF